MEDREFVVYQELRSLIVSRLEQAHYSAENVVAFCDMLREDLPEELTDSPEELLEGKEVDDSVKCCPGCEKPNQFGEQCPACLREEQDAFTAAQGA